MFTLRPFVEVSPRGVILILAIAMKTNTMINAKVYFFKSCFILISANKNLLFCMINSENNVAQ